MKRLKKILSVVLILLTLSLYFPRITFAEEGRIFAAAADVTKYPPEFLSSPEIDLPTEKEKKISGWTWVIIALLVLGGVGAGAGGGGGGGGSAPAPRTGNVGYGW